MQLAVSSVVIDWPEETMEITDMNGNKHTISLDTTIHVVMIGFPDKKQETMLARKLGLYIPKGYIIEEISFEQEKV